jgi:hypothetical protein
VLGAGDERVNVQIRRVIHARKGGDFVPIKWSGLRVIEAMDMAEEYVSQAIEPLEQALLVAEEAAKIPNLPDYMKDRINRLIDELKRMTGGVVYGQQMPSRLISVIDAIRDTIPKETLAGERARERAGTQQVLV